MRPNPTYAAQQRSNRRCFLRQQFIHQQFRKSTHPPTHIHTYIHVCMPPSHAGVMSELQMCTKMPNNRFMRVWQFGDLVKTKPVGPTEARRRCTDSMISFFTSRTTSTFTRSTPQPKSILAAVGWTVGWLVDWLVGRLVGWMSGRVETNGVGVGKRER